VDEAFVDLTGLPGTPAELASTLRRRILVRPLPSNTAIRATPTDGDEPPTLTRPAHGADDA
jgi:hypothetical protein